jgi:hypothetical protein
MSDVDWERIAAAIGLAVVLELIAYGFCSLIGITQPYRSMISTPIGVATVIAFYGSRKGKIRDGIPMAD